MQDPRAARIEADLSDALTELTPAARTWLVSRVADLVEAAVDDERRRCVEVCRQRAELWQRTTAAKSSVVPARDEARARANEARYLADLFESEAESAPVAVS